MQTADLVLEGGGVKGAGLAGAVGVLGQRYTFGRVAGTSAGAIVASFIAAGLTEQLEHTDGGMLSNFPVELFDDNDNPTFGVKLSAHLTLPEEGWHSTDDPLSLGKALISTMMSAHDQLHIDRDSICARTVFVDTTGVSSTNFRLSGAEKRRLFDNGASAAREFLT